MKTDTQIITKIQKSAPQYMSCEAWHKQPST